MKSREEVKLFLQPQPNMIMRCPLCSWSTGAVQHCDFCQANEDVVVDGLMAFFYPKPKKAAKKPVVKAKPVKPKGVVAKVRKAVKRGKNR